MLILLNAQYEPLGIIQYSNRVVDTENLSENHLKRALTMAKVALLCAAALPVALITVAAGAVLGVGLIAIGFCFKSKETSVTLKAFGAMAITTSAAVPIALIIKICRAVIGIFHPDAYFVRGDQISKAADEALPCLFEAVDKLLESNEQKELVKGKCRTIFSWTIWTPHYKETNATIGLYQHDYQEILIKIENVLAGKGGRILDDDEKTVFLLELYDMFEGGCVPSWGATLQQLSLSINEPTAPKEKVGYFVNTLKHRILDQMAMTYQPDESRHCFNALLHQIGPLINLPLDVVSIDIGCYIHDISEEEALARFNELFTPQVHSYVKDILNQDARADQRHLLLPELAILGGFPEEDEDGNDAIVQASIKFQVRTTNAKGGLVWKFNDEAIGLLIANG